MLLLLSCSRFGFSNTEKVHGRAHKREVELEGLLSSIESSSLHGLGLLLSKLDPNNWYVAGRVLQKCDIEKAKLVLERLATPQSEKEKRKKVAALIGAAIAHKDQLVTSSVFDEYWRDVQADQKHSLLTQAIGWKKWRIVREILEECEPCGHFFINDFISNDQEDLVERVWRISDKESKRSYLRSARSFKERQVLFIKLASEGECWTALKDTGLIIDDSAFLDVVIEMLFSDCSFLKKEIISTVSVRYSLEEELATKLWLRLYKEDRDIFLSVFRGKESPRGQSICKRILPVTLENNDAEVFELLYYELRGYYCVKILEDIILQFEGAYSEELCKKLIELLEPNGSLIIKCLEKRKANFINAFTNLGQKERVITAVEEEYVGNVARDASSGLPFRGHAYNSYNHHTRNYGGHVPPLYSSASASVGRALEDGTALFLLEHGIVSNSIFLKVCELEVETVKSFLNSGLLAFRNFSMAFDTAFKAGKYEICKYFVELGLNIGGGDYLFEILKQKPSLTDLLGLTGMGAQFKEEQDYLLELIRRMNASDEGFHEIFEFIISRPNSIKEVTNYAAAYLGSHPRTALAKLDSNIIAKLLEMSRVNKSGALLSLLKHAPNHEDAEDMYEQLINRFIELGCDVDAVLPEVISLLSKDSLAGRAVGGALEGSLVKILAASKKLCSRLCFENKLLDSAVHLGRIRLSELLLERGAFVNQRTGGYAARYNQEGYETIKYVHLLPIEIAEDSRLVSLLNRYGAMQFKGSLPGKEGLNKLLLFNEIPDSSLQSMILSDPFNIMVLIEEWSENFIRLTMPVSFSAISRYFRILEPKCSEKPDFAGMRKIYEEMMEYIRGALKARIAHKMIID